MGDLPLRETRALHRHASFDVGEDLDRGAVLVSAVADLWREVTSRECFLWRPIKRLVDPRFVHPPVLVLGGLSRTAP